MERVRSTRVVPHGERGGVRGGLPLAVAVVATVLGVVLWRTCAATDERLSARLPELAAEPQPAEEREIQEPALLAPLEVVEPRQDASAPDEEDAHEPSARPSAPGPVSAAPAQPRVGVLVLQGRVLFPFPERRGAPGASVVFGPFTTSADGEGFFRLTLDEAALAGRAPLDRRFLSDQRLGETALVAYLDGWVPALLPDAGKRVQRALTGRAALDPVELVLPAEALTITGTLLERTGAPAQGWRIALLDGTPAHADDYRPFSAEELAGGARSHVATGVDGRFTFVGLTAERSYRVRAWNQGTLEQVVSEPILAGTQGVVLQASSEPWRPIVDGVVVGLDGLPIPEVVCRLSMHEYSTENGHWSTTGQQVTTDGLGRFVFHDVPRTEIFLRCNLPGSGASRSLEPREEGRDLRIELVRSGMLVLEVTSKTRRPDTVRVLDEAGERLGLEFDTGPGRTSTVRDFKLSSSGECRARVSELARWVVLLQKDVEVGRLPLVVRWGADTQLEW